MTRKEAFDLIKKLNRKSQDSGLLLKNFRLHKKGILRHYEKERIGKAKSLKLHE